MASLIYSVLTSLDGYVEDRDGNFDWAEPDAEVHSFVNGLERRVGTHLYGRRLYETMSYWESDFSSGPPHIREFAEIWQGADKLVYSRTLEAAATARTRIEREFEPEAISAMKGSLDADLLIGGAELAGHAFRAGLIDEVGLFMVPVVVAGGKRALPGDVRLDLELLDERRFAGGIVYVRYRVSG